MEGLNDDISIIKSLIAITKGGLLLSKIQKEYFEMTEARLNFGKYGYKSLVEMLESSPEIKLKQSPEGLLCQVNDEKVNHVISLVGRTRSSKERKRKPAHKFSYRTKPSYYAPSKYISSPQREQFQSRYRPKSAVAPSQNRQPFHAVHQSEAIRPPNRMSVNLNVNFQGSKSFKPMKQDYSCSSGGFRKQHLHDNKFSSDVSSSSTALWSQQKHSHSNQNYSRWKENEEFHSHAPMKSHISETVHSRSSVQHLGDSSVRGRHFGSNTNGQISGAHSAKKEQQPGSLAGGQYCEGELVRSNSGSSWSSDFSSNSSSSNEKRVEKSKHLFIPRIVELKTSKPSHEDPQSSKVDIGPAAVSSISISVPRNVSDSDWSSDPDEPSISQHGRVLQSTASARGSSSMITSIVSSTRMVQDKSQTHTSDSSKHAHQEQDCPLMVGGIGRGKSHIQTKKPGFIGSHAAKSQFHEDNPSSFMKGLIVAGTPQKREVTATAHNGLSSILVKLRNSDCAKETQPSKKIPVMCSDHSYHNFEFIGDMYLQRIVDVCLRVPARRDKLGSRLGSRYCYSKLAISDCENQIVQNGAPDNVVLMIGMTDILKGATIQELKENTTALLERLKSHQVLLLTLPVPPSFIDMRHEKYLCVLEAYNKWLLKLDLPNKIKIDDHLYCEAIFYERILGSAAETLSEGGCWIVMDEIIAAIHKIESV